MDIQMKKGLLEACILRVVEDEPSYGYKIIGDISKYIEVSESTLYPILKRLETATCLNTFTKEYNGRLRKYYEITATGLQRIQYF
ncbi:MAG: PadR family transcriptional regulator, partial [Oscillospiraceae bacterium]